MDRGAGSATTPGPLAGHWTPGLGCSDPGEWELEPGHFAERLMLFLMIALGETIVASGLTASHLDAVRGTPTSERATS